MTINKALNFVVPVKRDDGTTIYVHSTPISRDIFNQHFLVISKAFTAIYTEGLGPYGGPRVAMMLLKKVAANMGEGQLELVEKGLIAEIHRLSNVLVPSDTGWSTIPLPDAVARGMVSLDDVDEVENAIAFFILASAMHKKEDALIMLPEAARLWSAQTTSLNSTAFAASLRTSIVIDNTGPKPPVTQSLIPS